MVLEKTLENPLDCKEIKSVNPKRSQPWIFIGRTDAEAETPILWPPDAKSRLIGNDPDAGKVWGPEEKGTTEDEMVGWNEWTWIWANSMREWRTGKPGVLQSTGSQSQTRLTDWTITATNFLFSSVWLIVGSQETYTTFSTISFNSHDVLYPKRTLREINYLVAVTVLWGQCLKNAINQIMKQGKS